MPVISLCFKKKNTSSSDSSSLLLFSSLPGNPDFPPLLLGKVRPLLKIGITILLLVSMHITHLLSSWFKRPSVFFTCDVHQPVHHQCHSTKLVSDWIVLAAEFPGKHKGHLQPELLCKVGTLNHSPHVSCTLSLLCIYTNMLTSSHVLDLSPLLW